MTLNANINIAKAPQAQPVVIIVDVVLLLGGIKNMSGT